MTLSVLLGTHHPAPMAAAILAPLREVADEIVIAVDQRLDVDTLGAYEELADRLLRYEFIGPRGAAWMHGQCSGDWVLRLDGDEAVSAALVAALPRMCADSEIRQYWLPTRWVWPDAGHWLAELPWWPDYHNRLVRNDDATWFDGRPHTGAHPALPARYVEEPLYHLDPVIVPESARVAKVAYNVAKSGPALVAPGGGELNARYYLPERHARLDPVPVPPEDRERLAAVVEAPRTFPARPPSGEVPLGLRADLEAVWAGRTREPEAYVAAIRPLERDHRMLAGETRNVFVAVRNHGTVTWPAGEGAAPEIRMSYHWRDGGGEMLVHDGGRTVFPAAVAPDEECIVPVLVTAPAEGGRYELGLDVIHEHVRWFDCETRIAMEVEAVDAPVSRVRSLWRRA